MNLNKGILIIVAVILWPLTLALGILVVTVTLAAALKTFLNKENDK